MQVGVRGKTMNGTEDVPDPTVMLGIRPLGYRLLIYISFMQGRKHIFHCRNNT